MCLIFRVFINEMCSCLTACSFNPSESNWILTSLIYTFYKQTDKRFIDKSERKYLLCRFFIWIFLRHLFQIRIIQHIYVRQRKCAKLSYFGSTGFPRPCQTCLSNVPVQTRLKYLCCWVIWQMFIKMLASIWWHYNNHCKESGVLGQRNSKWNQRPTSVRNTKEFCTFSKTGYFTFLTLSFCNIIRGRIRDF